MKYLIPFLIISAISCVRTKTRYETVEVEKKVEVEVPVEVEKLVEVPVKQMFEGYWYLQNGGTLEIIVGSDDRITLVTSGQNIQSINPKNGTHAGHPHMSGSQLRVVNGEIRFFKDLTYNSNHDVEEDISGANITGKKRTDFTISEKDGRLIIQIKIYSGASNSNPNNIVAKRTIKSV